MSNDYLKGRIKNCTRPVHNSEIFLMKEIGIDKKYFPAVKYPGLLCVVGRRRGLRGGVSIDLPTVFLHRLRHTGTPDTGLDCWLGEQRDNTSER